MNCKRDDCNDAPTGAVRGPYAYLCEKHTVMARQDRIRATKDPEPLHSLGIAAFTPRREDPAVGRTLRCGRHGCGKRLPDRAVEHGDPFCSAVCARAYHGVVSLLVDESNPGHGPQIGARSYTTAECAVCGTPWRQPGGCNQCAPGKPVRRAAAA